MIESDKRSVSAFAGCVLVALLAACQSYGPSDLDHYLAMSKKASETRRSKSQTHPKLSRQSLNELGIKLA